MSELINPRLLNRVERSLRKRLNFEVLPHLLRAAAHSHSEDEFMAAAARLLLNPQERQRWLASWAVRRARIEEQEGGTDTSPIDFDALTTTPSPLDALPPAPPADPRGFLITLAQRERVREALARELGPMADYLIDTEIHRSGSSIELLQRLESHLKTDDQRHRFREATAPAAGI